MKKLKNKRIDNFFRQLLVIKLEGMNAKETLEGSKPYFFILDMIPITELLHKELQRPKICESLLVKRKTVFCLASERERDVAKITLILRKIPEFKKFFKFNRINYDSIKQAANFMEYKRVPNGTCIFKQGEKSDTFYGIISGIISIRQEVKTVTNLNKDSNDDLQPSFMNKTNLVNNNEKSVVVEITEKEKLILTAGQYFGDWGILENKHRTASAYALDDTDLFYIDGDSFKQCFGKCMLKAELERKSLLFNTITPFRDLPKTKFNLIFRSMIILFLTKNEPVYFEGKTAENFYVIYEGVFKLLKKNFNDKKENNEENLKNDFGKHHVVLKLDHGDLTGLESLIDYVKTDNKDEEANTDNLKLPKYKHSLMAESDFNVVIAINPKLLGDELRVRVADFLRPIHEQKESILKSIHEKHMSLKNKMKLVFREELINKMSKTNMSCFSVKYIERNREPSKVIEECHSPKMQNKNKSNNELKFFKFQMNNSIKSDDETLVTNNLSSLNRIGNSSSVNITNFNQLANFNLKSLNGIQNNMKLQLRSHKNVKIKKFILNNSVVNDLESKKNTNNINANTTLSIKNYTTANLLHSQKNTILNSREFEDLLSAQSQVFSSQKQSTSNLFGSASESKFFTLKVDKQTKDNIVTTEHSKVKLDKKEDTDVKNKPGKLFLHKYIGKSIDQWKRMQENVQKDYDTGNYDLPMISMKKIIKNNENINTG